jgi:hypothetical protein
MARLDKKMCTTVLGQDAGTVDLNMYGIDLVVCFGPEGEWEDVLTKDGRIDAQQVLCAEAVNLAFEVAQKAMEDAAADSRADAAIDRFEAMRADHECCGVWA